MNLEKRSFDNLCHFYAEELRQINGGRTVTAVLIENTRSRLVKHGILKRRTKAHYIKKGELTAQAREVLGL